MTGGVQPSSTRCIRAPSPTTTAMASAICPGSRRAWTISPNSASMRSGSHLSTPHRCMTVAMTSRTSGPSIRALGRWTISTHSSADSTPAACDCSWTSSPTTRAVSTRGSRPPSQPAPGHGSGIATSSARATTASRRTTGAVSSMARDGRPCPDLMARPPDGGTCTCSTPPNPISTGRTRRSAPSSTTSCAGGSTAVSTVSASTSPMD